MSSSVGLGTTNPIKAGSIRAFIDLTSVADTDWHSLTSADFKDSISGSSCDAGLKFEWIGVNNQGLSNMHIKYRAADSASDVTTNEIQVSETYKDDVATLRDEVTTVAYKKSGASDVVFIIAGFSQR